MRPELTDRQRRTAVEKDRTRLIQTNEHQTYLTIAGLQEKRTFTEKKEVEMRIRDGLFIKNKGKRPLHFFAAQTQKGP